MTPPATPVTLWDLPATARADRHLEGGIIVVEDRLDGQCVRHVHLMSNAPIEEAALRPFGIPTATATIEAGQSAGSHWLKAKWAYRGVWNVNAASREGKFRRLVVWSLSPAFQASGSGLSVRGGLREAKAEFERLFGSPPMFGFVKSMPRGGEHGMEFEGMTLCEAEWMPEKCIAVGGRK